VFTLLTAHGALGLLFPGSPTFDRRNIDDYMRWV
jgi:hypothetical protein